MSGGYFDYDQFRINDIIDKLERVIHNNDNKELDEWGEPKFFNFPPEVIEKFQEALETLEKSFRMVHRIDYLLEGDDGIETFIKHWKEDLGE